MSPAMDPKSTPSRLESDLLRSREMARSLYGIESDTDYLWCVVCERTFRRGHYRQVGEHRLCPYDQCEGGLLFEPWEWTQVRRANPDYPRVPSEDVLYPFFGRGK